MTKKELAKLKDSLSRHDRPTPSTHGGRTRGDKAASQAGDHITSAKKVRKEILELTDSLSHLDTPTSSRRFGTRSAVSAPASKPVTDPQFRNVATSEEDIEDRAPHVTDGDQEEDEETEGANKAEDTELDHVRKAKGSSGLRLDIPQVAGTPTPPPTPPNIPSDALTASLRRSGRVQKQPAGFEEEDVQQAEKERARSSSETEDPSVPPSKNSVEGLRV